MVIGARLFQSLVFSLLILLVVEPSAAINGNQKKRARVPISRKGAESAAAGLLQQVQRVRLLSYAGSLAGVKHADGGRATAAAEYGEYNFVVAIEKRQEALLRLEYVTGDVIDGLVDTYGTRAHHAAETRLRLADRQKVEPVTDSWPLFAKWAAAQLGATRVYLAAMAKQTKDKSKVSWVAKSAADVKETERKLIASAHELPRRQLPKPRIGAAPWAGRARRDK